MTRSLKLDNVQNIGFSDKKGIYSICKLYKLTPHKKICFFRGPDNNYHSQQRLQLCKKFFLSHYHINIENRIFNGQYNLKKSAIIAKKLIESKKYNFFFCFNDSMAYGIYQAANSLNVKIGTDISVAGFDNLYGSLDPHKIQLTTVNVDLSQWSKMIVSNLLKEINKPTTISQYKQSIKTQFILGSSVKLNKNNAIH